MAVTEPCRKKTLYAIFRKASKLSPGDNTIAFVKCPSFAIGHCLGEDPSHVSFGHPDRFIGNEETDAAAIEAVIVSLQGFVRRAPGESNPSRRHIDENWRTESRHQGGANQETDDSICDIQLS